MAWNGGLARVERRVVALWQTPSQKDGRDAHSSNSAGDLSDDTKMMSS